MFTGHFQISGSGLGRLDEEGDRLADDAFLALPHLRAARNNLLSAGE
jgi:hypothetical protein